MVLLLRKATNFCGRLTLIRCLTPVTKVISKVRKEAKAIEDQIRDSMKSQEYEALDNVSKAQKELENKAKKVVLEEQYTNEMKEQNKIIADRTVLENKAQSTAQIAKRTDLIQKGVRGMSLAYSTLVPIIATYNSVQEKSISKQDGVIAGLQTTSAMLMASMNPWGMAAGAAAGAFSLMVDKFDLFKSRGEKAKEVNDQLTKTFMSLQETVSGNISNLNDIADTYKRFEGVNAEAFINNAPDPSDTKAFEKYNKNLEDYDNLAGKIALQIFRIEFSTCHNRNILQHFFLIITKTRSFCSHHIKCSTKFIQCRKNILHFLRCMKI